jgi:hypothetical protein
MLVVLRSKSRCFKAAFVAVDSKVSITGNVGQLEVAASVHFNTYLAKLEVCYLSSFTVSRINVKGGFSPIVV